MGEVESKQFENGVTINSPKIYEETIKVCNTGGFSRQEYNRKEEFFIKRTEFTHSNK